MIDMMLVGFLVGLGLGGALFWIGAQYGARAAVWQLALLAVRPGDIVVVKLAGELPQADISQLKEALGRALPADARSLMLGPSVGEIAVLRGYGPAKGQQGDGGAA